MVEIYDYLFLGTIAFAIIVVLLLFIVAGRRKPFYGASQNSEKYRGREFVIKKEKCATALEHYMADNLLLDCSDSNTCDHICNLYGAYFIYHGNTNIAVLLNKLGYCILQAGLWDEWMCDVLTDSQDIIRR